MTASLTESSIVPVRTCQPIKLEINGPNTKPITKKYARPPFLNYLKLLESFPLTFLRKPKIDPGSILFSPTRGIYLFFSFFCFRFCFGLSWAFFCCSFLPLSFFPLSPISVSPCLNPDPPDGFSQSPTLVAQWASDRESGPELSL